MKIYLIFEWQNLFTQIVFICNCTHEKSIYDQFTIEGRKALEI